ncbi:MAG: hypothetical protein QOE99_684 [Actinomycetota bacterium]|nr:hypothetical protein [Actinomycetota bacterium]
MQLQLSAEQSQLRDASRRLLADRLTALVTQLPEPPVHNSEKWVRDAQQLGWLGLGIPEQYGGAGGFEDLVLVHEELGRGLAPSLLTALGLSARVLLHCDTGPGRDELLEQVVAGTLLAAPVLDGDITLTQSAGGARLDGRAVGVVDATEVTDLLVAAEGDGTTALVRVPWRSAGVTLTQRDTGCDVPSYTLSLAGVTLPADAVVAKGVEDALAATRRDGVILAAARALGGGRAVLERTVEHVRTRHQFGVSIGTFQAVQHQLSDIATALDAAGLAVARAAWSVQTGLDAAQAAAVAALAATEAFASATLVAHQLHGGMGFVLDSPLHLWSARAVSDPTAPRARRDLLDALGDAVGIRGDGVRVAPQHRQPA